MLEKIISSPLLYPLFRIGWFELAFFRFFRLFNKAEVLAFQFYNFGFDISKWQGFINFFKMVAYGAKFLILRCAYGIRIDERFIENMAGVGSLLPLSAYHYYDPIYSPESQAAKVIEVLAPYKHRIRRVWLDLEFSWDGTYTDPKHWKTYRDRIKAAGYRIGWYTRKTWWDSRVGTYAAEFAKDPCWAAQYNTSLNLIPKGWTKPMIWQNGIIVVANGEAGTDSKEIDNDLWNDEFSFFDEWNKELGGTPTTPPPEPPTGGTMPTYTVKAKADNTKIFKNYDGSGGNIDDNFDMNETAKGDSINYAGYMHLYQMNGVNMNGYIHTSKITYTLDVVAPPPVDPPPPTEPEEAYLISYDAANNPLNRYNKQ